MKIDDVTDELTDNPDFSSLAGDGSLTRPSLADYAESLAPTSELMSALAVEQPGARKTPLSPRTSLAQGSATVASLNSLDLNDSSLDLKLSHPGVPLASQLFPKVLRWI